MTGTHWRPAYIALGSNLDDPPLQVRRALDELAGIEGVRMILCSDLYASDPLGPPGQPRYVNAVAGVLTTLEPRALLTAMLEVERRMGRVRAQRWGPRRIDLDLICMAGVRVEEPGLTLPHPEVPERNFVLYPLAEIAPSLELPGLGRVSELAARVHPAGIQPLHPERRS